MCKDEVCMGVHEQIQRGMHALQCGRVAYPCPLEQSCMTTLTTHGGQMAAQVVRVAQVTGACGDIGFQARCREGSERM